MTATESGVAGRSVRLTLGLGVAALIVMLDQAVKWWILAVVMQPPRVIEVTSYFNLVLTWNRGVSFGMFSHGSAWMPYVWVGLAAAIGVFLVGWLWRTDRLWLAGSLGLILGGAIGNAVDRLRFGAVADFLDFHVNSWHWPAFNIADSAISIGVALIIIDSLFRGRSSI